MTAASAFKSWLIRPVFLFAGAALHETVALRGVKVDIATSERSAGWEAANDLPAQPQPRLRAL